MPKDTKLPLKTKLFLVYYYVKLPKSFKGVSVGQYQLIYPIYQKIEKETDSMTIASDWCRIISILTDMKPNEVEALPIDKLKKAIKQLSFLGHGEIKPNCRKYLFVNGKLHRAKSQAKEFSAAQGTDIKSFLNNGGYIPQMHKILASMYTPITLPYKHRITGNWTIFKYDAEGHEERAEAFKKMSVAKVYPTVFFYSILWERWMKRIREYGLKIAEEENRKAQELLMLTLRETLESIGDGTPQ